MTGGKSGISMILTPGKSGYRTVIWVNTVNTPGKVTTWLPGGYQGGYRAWLPGIYRMVTLTFWWLLLGNTKNSLLSLMEQN